MKRKRVPGGPACSGQCGEGAPEPAGQPVLGVLRPFRSAGQVRDTREEPQSRTKWGAFCGELHPRMSHHAQAVG